MASEDLNWKRSSRCESNGCVEVMLDPAQVWVSGTDEWQILKFTADEWRVFVAGVKAGEFDV